MTPLERRLTWAGWLIVCGLVVQLATLIAVHPLAFVTFLLVTCPLVIVGMLLYLHALVTFT
jgi:hypothetical protein